MRKLSLYFYDVFCSVLFDETEDFDKKETFKISDVDFMIWQNVLPLPPRTNKPKLVDKPRHIRKYPLKLPSEAKTTQTELTGVHVIQPIIYQNTQADDQDVTSSVNQPTLMTGEVTLHPEDAFVGPTVVHVPYVLAVMSAQNLPQVVAHVSVDETGTPPALANTNPFVGDDQIEKDDKPPMSAEEFFATTKARPPVAIIFEDSDAIIPYSSGILTIFFYSFLKCRLYFTFLLSLFPVFLSSYYISKHYLY